MATMLIVEDDRLIALVLRRQLARLGHTVLPPVASAEDGLAVVLTSHPAVVFMDLYCADLLDRLTVGPLIEAVGTPVVYLSHASRAAFPAAHGGLAPLFHLMKPLAAEVVARTLEWALAYGALQRLVQALRHGVVERLAQVPILEARGYPIVPPGQERRERLEGRDPAPEESPAP
jgi:CheY-like chemotaxis protein